MDSRLKEYLIAESKAANERDDWTALEALWEPYIREGDVEGQFHLAYFYFLYGWDEGPGKHREMLTLLCDAANQNHADATYLLSQQERGERNPKRDLLLLRAAELGSREAQRDLGALYATGDWTRAKDPAKAVMWYRLAAERGHDDAQYNLGFMYVLGEGTSQDITEGLRWLELSARQGNSQSMRLLADLYGNGYYGISVDLDRAAHWEELLAPS